MIVSQSNILKSAASTKLVNTFERHTGTVMALVAIGFRSISMAPPSIGPVKSMLLELDVGAVRAIVERHLASQAPMADLKAELADFARAGGVPI